MFGYVLPSKGELKMKDYEKFKAYYCGLCICIKNNYGNLPRAVLNYDMTFLAVLLDALSDDKCNLVLKRCLVHPMKKKPMIINNKAIEYAAFFNVTLAYFKLIDNVNDDKSKLSSVLAFFLKHYIKKVPENLQSNCELIKNKLIELANLEKNYDRISIDELTDPFAALTGHILSLYPNDDASKKILYNLGYNLGKWIYLIDAFDDLENDMKNNKFNAIAAIFNKENLKFESFKPLIEDRIDFILVTSARNCFECLDSLPLKTNKDILFNILQLGLLEKMDKVFGRLNNLNDY